jgi:hypothetical protein
MIEQLEVLLNKQINTFHGSEIYYSFLNKMIYLKCHPLVRNESKFWGSLNYHSAAILTIIANAIKNSNHLHSVISGMET